MSSLWHGFIAVLGLWMAWKCWTWPTDDLVLGQHDRWLLRLLACLFAAAAALLLLGVVSQALAAPPARAEGYRALLTRTAHAEAGLQAPVSTFAAQIQQESAWNPKAVSGEGAAGMAQFMPNTADWMGDIDRRLAPADVYNPGWAIRALIVYDLWLFDRIQAATHCDKWAMTLAAYNGGLGWVYRDQALASKTGFDQLAWFDSVERLNAGRSAANWQQNRDYPRRILLTLEPQYIAAGWGVGVCDGWEDR